MLNFDRKVAIMHAFTASTRIFLTLTFFGASTLFLLVASARADTLVVTGKNFTETVSSTTLLRESELSLMRGTHIHDVLMRVPGVSFNQSGGAGTLSNLFIRGLSGRYVAVRFNGIKFNSPVGQATLWQNLNTLGLARILVTRGTQSALYGSEAIGGVIDIESVIGGTHTNTINTIIGGQDTRAIDLVSQGYTQNNRLEYGVGLQHFTSDSISARRDNDETDPYQNNALVARVRWHANDQVALLFSSYANRGRSTYDNCSRDFLNDTNDCKSEHQTQAIRFGIAHGLGARTDEFAVTLYRDDRNDEINGAAYSETLGQRAQIEYRGVYQLTDAMRFVFGAEAETTTLDSRAPFLSVPRADRAHTRAIWGMWDATFADQARLTLSLRVNDHNAFGSFVSYRASVLWVFTSTMRLRAVVSRGFRAPSLDELYYPGSGNPSLSPERAQSYEIGIIATPRADLALEATLFDITLNDRIGYNFSTFSSAQIGGKTRSRGIEVHLRWKPKDTIQLSTSYSYNDAQKPDGIQDIRRPRHILAFDIEYQPHPKISWGVSLLLVRKVTDTDFSIGRDVVLDNYALINLRANYQINEAHNLFARIDNVFDDDYQTVLGYNSPQAQLILGVRRHF